MQYISVLSGRMCTSLVCCLAGCALAQCVCMVDLHYLYCQGGCVLVQCVVRVDVN